MTRLGNNSRVTAIAQMSSAKRQEERQRAHNEHTHAVRTLETLRGFNPGPGGARLVLRVPVEGGKTQDVVLSPNESASAVSGLIPVVTSRVTAAAAALKDFDEIVSGLSDSDEPASSDADRDDEDEDASDDESDDGSDGGA